VVVVADGAQAWALLRLEDAPSFAILDWMMPEIDGLEVCRRVRSIPTTTPPYLMLLTAQGEKTDVVVGLDAGANDLFDKAFRPVGIARANPVVQPQLDERSAASIKRLA
jgi:DNA-binding response OmpR family regulator